MKNREYAKEAAQIFAPGASGIAREQDASEGCVNPKILPVEDFCAEQVSLRTGPKGKFAAKPTQPGAPEERFALWGKASAETDSSGCFGIDPLTLSLRHMPPSPAGCTLGGDSTLSLKGTATTTISFSRL